MVELLVFLFIIYWIKKKTAQKSSGVDKKQKKQTVVPQSGGNTYRPAFDTADADRARSQQELKQRLLEKYGQPQKTAEAPKNETEHTAYHQEELDLDTLSSSVQTAGSVRKTADSSGGSVPKTADSGVSGRKLAADMPKEKEYRQKEKHISVQQTDVTAEESSELMRIVEERMILGYQEKLSFERDFVGEGMEMLSRFDSQF